MGFTVTIPGLLTTIQDEGRFGYGKYGVSPSGPMDLKAFRIANILVGNEWNESALEATILGPTLTFDADAVIALTGADMDARLNDNACPMYRSVAVRAGDQLRFGAVKTGCRTYIAFAGGLDVPLMMGSRATAIQNQIGGFQGRKLAKGDYIGIRTTQKALKHYENRSAPLPDSYAGERTVRVILGPQDHAFTETGLQTFLNSPYSVGKDFDRMGYRLDGPVIEHIEDGNIISDGMATGAIQVPTSGQPIIMMAERQTTGGYTKIATVISVDLPIVAQCKTGDVIHFRSVSLEEAHVLWRQQDSELRGLEARLSKPAFHYPSKKYTVTVNGVEYQVDLTRVQ